MTTPVYDINEVRKRILAGEKFPPEFLAERIAQLRAERFEKVVEKAEKRIKKGDLSKAEQDASLSVFDNI